MPFAQRKMDATWSIRYLDKLQSPRGSSKKCPCILSNLVPNLTKNSVVIIIDSSQLSLGLISGIRYDVHHPAI